MPTYFILRSPYLPSNRKVVQLEASSPLAWFQQLWPRFRNDPDVTTLGILGVEQLYGLTGFMQRVREKALPEPKTYEELGACLYEHCYSQIVGSRQDYVLVLTDDDEVELAYWWIGEDEYRNRQNQFACCAVDELPYLAGDGKFEPDIGVTDVATACLSEGCLYALFATIWDSGNLDGLRGPFRLAGTRIAEFPDALCALRGKRGHPLELDWLALLAKQNPAADLKDLLNIVTDIDFLAVSSNDIAVHEGTIAQRTVEEQNRWPGRRRSERSHLVAVGPHHAEFRQDDGFGFHVWYFFDDIWASANPVLANSLLRFVCPFPETRAPMKQW